jgi:hypothetical protein
MIRFSIHIDVWVHRRVEQVARRDHVRPPEKHHGVTIRVRVRHVDQLDRLVVEEQVLAGREVGFDGPALPRDHRLLRVRVHRTDTIEHVLVRPDRRSRRHANTHATHILAGRRDDRVAARMVRVIVRIDDVVELPVRQLAQFRKDGFCILDQARIDNQHAFVADLDGDVPACAADHVDIAAHMLNDKLRGRGSSRLRGTAAAGGLRRMGGKSQRAQQHGDGHSHPALSILLNFHFHIHSSKYLRPDTAAEPLQMTTWSP